jgi:hypothetical protein
MTFDEILAQLLDLLRRQGRVSYRALKRRFAIDDDYLEDLKAELIDAQHLAVDEDERVLVWCGGPATAGMSASDEGRAPLSYTPKHLAEKILTSRSALEGERKQVTVLFADLKGSMELLADRDPEEARQLLDPVLERMMEAVHRYEGTVNQVMGDGIMALFGAPISHEDHAMRACYAAMAMQTAIRSYLEEVRRGLTHLQAAEFLYETCLFPELEYTFKHALTHQVAYGNLLQERRRALHARIVDAPEALYADGLADQVEQLAHHAFRAEVWDKALPYCRQAGAKVTARSANREAVAYLEQALVALQHLPESRKTRERPSICASTCAMRSCCSENRGRS